MSKRLAGTRTRVICSILFAACLYTTHTRAQDKADLSPRIWLSRACEYAQHDTKHSQQVISSVAVEYARIHDAKSAGRIVNEIGSPEERDNAWRAVAVALLPHMAAGELNAYLQRIHSKERQNDAIRALATRYADLRRFSDCQALMSQLPEDDRAFLKLELAQGLARAGKLDEARSILKEADSYIQKIHPNPSSENWDFVLEQRAANKVLDTCSKIHPIDIPFTPPTSTHAAIRDICEQFASGSAFIVGADQGETTRRANAITDPETRSGAFREIARVAMKTGHAKDAHVALAESIRALSSADAKHSVSYWLQLLLSADYLLDLNDRDAACAIIDRANRQNAYKASGETVSGIEMGGMERYLLRAIGICVNVRLNKSQTALDLTSSDEPSNRNTYLMCWAAATVENGGSSTARLQLDKVHTDLDRAAICIGMASGLINLREVRKNACPPPPSHEAGRK